MAGTNTKHTSRQSIVAALGTGVHGSKAATKTRRVAAPALLLCEYVSRTVSERAVPMGNAAVKASALPAEGLAGASPPPHVQDINWEPERCATCVNTARGQLCFPD